jgi:D-alanine-D-alanine ligase
MKTIALVFGGKSPEHEISVRSAKNILAAIDRNLFKVVPIGIDPNGVWRLTDTDTLGAFVPDTGTALALVPGVDQHKIIRLDHHTPIEDPEAVLLILHGPQGEDGTVQGLLRIMDLPFIGPDVLGSAVCMDKDFAKRLLKEAGLQVAKGYVFGDHERDSLSYTSLVNELGSPIFVKPANMGSSVGVHKVKDAAGFEKAIADAFLYDRKVIVEEMIYGRELECAVLGNAFPKPSVIGEVITAEEYSFDAKYVSATAAQTRIPAALQPGQMEALQQTAIRAYQALGCEVLSRVDMFLTEEGQIYVNEINTLPGFTSISMYPQLWEHDGLSYTHLITQLIELAMDRHQKRAALQTQRVG